MALTNEHSRNRATEELKAALMSGMTISESMRSALDVYDRAEAERREIEECHAKVRRHFGAALERGKDTAAGLRADEMIREARQS